MSSSRALRSQRRVVGYEVVYGGCNPSWSVRADLSDGSAAYMPLFNGFDIPGLEPAPADLPVQELRRRMGHLMPPEQGRSGRWRHRLSGDGNVTWTPLSLEKSAELAAKVDAACSAIEAALTVEHAKLDDKYG